MNQIERIKIKLRLAKCTDLFLEVFGADSHKYKVGKPLSLSELTEFEKNFAGTQFASGVEKQLCQM